MSDSPSQRPVASTPRLGWGAEALWESLQPVLPGLSVEVVARLDSTNSRLLERARVDGGDRSAQVSRPGDLDDGTHGAERTRYGRRAADLAPCLLVAEEQTAGRGRMGRHWVSTPGRSLTFSLALTLAPSQWGGLSLAVGTALADALEPRSDDPGAPEPRLALKWPNDLWLLDPAAPGGGRKLGGVLIETVAVGTHRMAVVGVGLNVLPSPAALPAASPPLTHGFACLQELDAAATAPAALARVAVPLARAVKRFEREGLAPFLTDFAARDLLRGRPVVISGPQTLEGVADGIDAQGALRVQADGVAHLIVSGEASVRLASSS